MRRRIWLRAAAVEDLVTSGGGGGSGYERRRWRIKSSIEGATARWRVGRELHQHSYGTAVADLELHRWCYGTAATDLELHNVPTAAASTFNLLVKGKERWKSRNTTHPFRNLPDFKNSIKLK
ncbi:hypothetical protein LINPERHAP2_LOCUS38570 [Linum perenne]